MAPGQVLFDQAGLGRGKVGGRGVGKSAAVRGLERGTSFGEVIISPCNANNPSFLKPNFREVLELNLHYLYFKIIQTMMVFKTSSNYDQIQLKSCPGKFESFPQFLPCANCGRSSRDPRNLSRQISIKRMIKIFVKVLYAPLCGSGQVLFIEKPCFCSMDSL